MEINWTTPIINNYPIVLQSSANINFLFLDYKKLEQSKALLMMRKVCTSKYARHNEALY